MSCPRALVSTLCCVALLAACRSEEAKAPEPPPPASEAAPSPEPPVSESLLDREGILIAALRAGSAKALGIDDTARQRELAGRPFEFRIRFGCPAAAAAGDVGEWQFDERRRVLRVAVNPDLTSATQLPAAAVPSFEQVEGFWVRRPWQLVAECPIQPGAAETDPMDKAAMPEQDGSAAVELAEEPNLGIAQFYGAADARTHRRNNRGFETTKTLKPDQQPSGRGYDFVLTGRLKALPDGRVIACAATRVDQPPRCVVSAQFDRVYLQAPGRAAVLAEWTAS